MKQQIIILQIKYDETESLEPKSWNWPEILNCKGNCVEVLNYGKAENLEENYE